MTKHYTIPIFVPELACPYQCVFCNQEKISGQKKIPNRNEIITTIENYLKTFKSKDRIVEVGFFGGSFTGIPVKDQKYYLEIIQPYVKSGAVSGIRLSTRPDYINDEILKVLQENNVTTIELGAQSFDDDVLLKSNRGHLAKQIEIASKMILDGGFSLGLQMMIGLPGDTLEKTINTAGKIIESGANNTRIYPALVIKDTALHMWYTQKKYKPLTLNEAITWTKQILLLFEEAGVNVIRVGLHPSEGLLSGEELIAGPFHPAFKELVMSSIWTDILAPLLSEEANKTIKIHVPAEEINYAIGHKSANKKMLLKKFDSVIFVPEESYTGRNFILKSVN